MPVCVDWLSFDDSTTNDPILVSCDIKGNIFKYNLSSNLHTRYFPENKHISQLKTCPGKHLVAIGYCYFFFLKHVYCRTNSYKFLDINKEQLSFWTSRMSR